MAYSFAVKNVSQLELYLGIPGAFRLLPNQSIDLLARNDVDTDDLANNENLSRHLDSGKLINISVVGNTDLTFDQLRNPPAESSGDSSSSSGGTAIIQGSMSPFWSAGNAGAETYIVAAPVDMVLLAAISWRQTTPLTASNTDYRVYNITKYDSAGNASVIATFNTSASVGNALGDQATNGTVRLELTGSATILAGESVSIVPSNVGNGQDQRGVVTLAFQAA